MSGADSTEASSSARGRLLSVLKLVLAAAILAWVGTQLPWRDQLTYTVDEKLVLSVEGEILGDWKEDQVAFQLDAELQPDADWPPALRAALEAEGVFRGERVESEDPKAPRWDWKPSLPRAFKDVESKYLVRAMGAFLVALVCANTRWWRLLALAGCFATFFNTLRLTFIGLFFNLVVPGLTGGDLVKGVVVARENPGKRADAFVSVVVDRIIGLLSLVGLAAVVILIRGGELAVLRPGVLGCLAVGVGGALVYVSPQVRRLVRYETLLKKLPFSDKLQQLDAAAVLYAKHPLQVAIAILLSLANHAFAILGCVFLGHAFGAGLSLLDYYVVVPVANILSALPLAPGGWGLGEAIYKYLFNLAEEGSGTLGVAVSVTFRLAQLALGLVGGLFLLLPGARVDLSEVEREAAQA